MLDDFPIRIAPSPHYSERILLAVGALIDKKGFDILLKACGLLKQRRLAFKCRIIGEGPERVRLESLVRALSLEDVVEIPGSLPFSGLKKEYSQAALFVMPSKVTPNDSDGLPTVLIESMALSCGVATAWREFRTWLSTRRPDFIVLMIRNSIRMSVNPS
jgi:glycosyltransferase involved in cell wall biosynthesis